MFIFLAFICITSKCNNNNNNNRLKKQKHQRKSTTFTIAVITIKVKTKTIKAKNNNNKAIRTTKITIAKFFFPFFIILIAWLVAVIKQNNNNKAKATTNITITNIFLAFCFFFTLCSGCALSSPSRLLALLSSLVGRSLCVVESFRFTTNALASAGRLIIEAAELTAGTMQVTWLTKSTLDLLIKQIGHRSGSLHWQPHMIK